MQSAHRLILFGACRIAVPAELRMGVHVRRSRCSMARFRFTSISCSARLVSDWPCASPPSPFCVLLRRPLPLHAAAARPLVVSWQTQSGGCEPQPEHDHARAEQRAASKKGGHGRRRHGVSGGLPAKTPHGTDPLFYGEQNMGWTGPDGGGRRPRPPLAWRQSRRRDDAGAHAELPPYTLSLALPRRKSRCGTSHGCRHMHVPPISRARAI